MRGHASGAASEKDGDAKPDEAAREKLLNALAAEQDGGQGQEP